MALQWSQSVGQFWLDGYIGASIQNNLMFVFQLSDIMTTGIHKTECNDLTDKWENNVVAEDVGKVSLPWENGDIE